MHEQVAYWSEVVSIDGHLDKRPQDLSGGQKQRVSMAGVLINEAPILLFDEPLANLDPAAGKEAIHLIDRIHQKNETTIVIIEHRLEDVLASPVDRIIIFNEGKIIADDTPEKILKTNILTEIGIREPLYITAMKKAGVDLDQITAIADVETVNGPNLKEQMQSWQGDSLVKEPAIAKEPLLALENITYRYRKHDRFVLENLTTTIGQAKKSVLLAETVRGNQRSLKPFVVLLRPKGR